MDENCLIYYVLFENRDNGMKMDALKEVPVSERGCFDDWVEEQRFHLDVANEDWFITDYRITSVPN